MPFDLSNLNPSTKFMYSENGEETGEYICLRLASDADNKRFFNSIGVKEKVEQIYNPKTRQMDRQTYFHTNEDQREQFNEIVWDFSITDWKLFSTEKDEDDELHRDSLHQGKQDQVHAGKSGLCNVGGKLP